VRREPCTLARCKSIRSLSIALLISISAPLGLAQGQQGGKQKPDACTGNLDCIAFYKRARALADKQQYSAALSAYQEAYKVGPAPWLLVNIGRMQQLLGNPAEALQSYDQFLSSPSADQFPSFIQSAKTYREQALADQRRISQPVPPPSSLPTENSEVRKPPADRPATEVPLLVEPVAVTQGRPASEASPILTAGPIHAAAAAGPLPPSAVNPAQPTRDPASPVYKKWWFWTAIGVVVAAGVTGGVVGALARRDDGMEQPDPMNMTMNPTQRMLPMPGFHPFE
jgi:tetratricopeptide (TPR) repeat protein